MKQDIKKFGKRLGIFLALLIIIDVVGGKLLEPLYLHQKSGSAFKTVYAVETCKEPLVILGSSRAYHHYRTTMIEQKLKVESYNAGRDGTAILYDYAIYKTICTRAIPKYLIIDFNLEDLGTAGFNYDILSQLLPHYNKNRFIKEVVNLRSPLECIKAQSSLYRYNSELFYMLVHDNKTPDEEKGFLPLYGQMTDAPDLPATPEKQLNNELVRYFDRLLLEAQQNGTKVFVFVSPTLNSFKQKNMSCSMAEEICNRHHVPFFYFAQDTAFTKHPEYFNDYSHLNIQGATAYTNIVIDTLHRFINN